jgi:ABC-2 type transport system permease protein
MKVASMPFLPSWWVGQGIIAISHKDWLRSFMFFGLLFTTTAVVGFFVYDFVSRMLRPAFLKLKEVNPRSTISKKNTKSVFSMLSLPLPSDAGAIIKKDILNMWRDPVWWLQGMMFFGLLALYFLNIRNMHYHMLAAVWRNMIAFLNIFSLGAIMSSCCSRFIYPQLSLEGSAFWLLGLAPISIKKILFSKFLSASLLMLLINLLLIYISSSMLNVLPEIKITALIISAFMTFALCAIATGLGAIFIDPGKTDPVKIVSGFGGTLNLVLSLGYIILSIIPIGVLFHWHTIGLIKVDSFRTALSFAYLWLIIISAISITAPLKLGCRALKNRDY